MSLLDELRSLNVDAIVNARGGISASVQAPEVQAILTSGSASSALGTLGSGLDAVRGSFSDPTAMLQPLMDRIGGLGGQFDTANLPLGDFTNAVREGLEFILRLISSISGNPSDFGQIFGSSMGEVVRIAGERAGDFSGLFGLRADSFADLSRMSAQSSATPSALVDLAADILLPLPKTNLRAMRAGIAGILADSGNLRLPVDRTTGLVLALDTVATAAASGNLASLNSALANLQQVRTHVLGVVRNDLLFAVQQVNNIRVPQVLRPFEEFSRTVRLGQQGVVEFLEDLRLMIRSVREQVDNPDFEQIRQFLRALAPQIEDRARQAIEVPIDKAVDRATEFIRRTMRQLPVYGIRNEITRFLLDAAQAIQNAGLDEPANAVRNALAEVSRQLDAGAITGQVQAALQQVNQTLTQALDGVIDALDTIQAQVDALADAAEGILQRLVDGLEAFQAAIDSVQIAIDGLGIEQVEQQLVEALTALRETATAILEAAPLPEPLRPQVEQLISLLEGVDFDEVFEPVRAVVAELRVPDDVAGVVEDGLAEAKRVVENLIPAELIASIEAEVSQALSTIANFNPASLLPDVSQYLEQAASLIESLDPRPLAEQVRGPFQTVLDVVDRVHPQRVLAPVIDAYDSLWGSIPVPDGEGVARGVRTAFDAAGNVAGRAVVEPARHVTAGDGETEVADPQTQTPTPELPPAFNEIRAGDAIRFLGFVPARLRELLQSIDAGPAGDILRQVDELCSGLAAQIRQLQAALYAAVQRLDDSFEELLSPLGPSQLRAQLAIQANFGSDASFQASLNTVALAGPGALRRELAESLSILRNVAQDAAAAAGGSAGGSLERIAQALESAPFSRLSGDLEAFLAALDPEPIAAELDNLVSSLLQLFPQLVQELLPDVRSFVERLQAIINHYNPGAQAQKFLVLMDVVREELNFLDPRRLAAELTPLHGAIRSAIAAYDPRLFAEEIAGITAAMAQEIRGLNPTELLGDLNFLQTTVDRISQANPADRLASVGASLAEVGERLGSIDLDALIESVNQLGPRLIDSFESLIEAVRNEIVALLEALRFATGSASGSVSVEVGVG